MLRVALFATSAALLMPAAASAAPFAELPPTSVSGSATCLRATGLPGELVRSSPTGARFLTVTAAGVSDAGGVVSGVASSDCPQVAARPSGAGILAQAGAGLWVATREPGGPWGTPAKLAPEASTAAVAVADSGAAVVAWLEPVDKNRFNVKAMRRAAGGTFAPAVVLGSARSRSEYSQQGSVRAAIAADGEAIVLWTQPPPDEDTLRVPVLAAIAPAGGTFGAAQRIGESMATSAPALAAEPGGRVLAAFWDGQEVRVAERAPGGSFGAAATVARVRDIYVTTPAVTLGPSGAAVVGWYSLLTQGVGAVARAAAGSFGTPVTLVSGGLRGLGKDELALFQAFGFAEIAGTIGASGVDPDRDGGDLRAALTADGRALLTWNGFAGGLAAQAATFPLAGGHLDRWRLGSQVRPVSSVAPLLLPGGGVAAAWSDNDYDSERSGLVHVAVEGGAAAADPAPPVVTLGRPRDSVLGAAEKLELPVRCSAACDVRIDLPGHFGTGDFISLPGAGSRTATIDPVFIPIAPVGRGPVRVRLRYAAPGARSATERIETVILRGLPKPRVPRVLGLRAVRHGSNVDVTWRTDIAAATDAFVVLGAASRTEMKAPVFGSPGGNGKRRRFHVRLRKAGEVRFVTVLFGAADRIETSKTARVR